MVKKLKDEGGYSLVEVMVAIMLLSIAIIPMVGMFDAGLRAAVLGGNYDTARAIAGEELEEIQALPFKVDPNPPADSVLEIYPPGTTPTPCTGPILTSFGCQVKATYVSVGASSVTDDSNARAMLKVEVTVTWAGGRSYKTTGLVSKETRCAIAAEC